MAADTETVFFGHMRDGGQFDPSSWTPEERSQWMTDILNPFYQVMQNADMVFPDGRGFTGDDLIEVSDYARGTQDIMEYVAEAYAVLHLERMNGREVPEGLLGHIQAVLAYDPDHNFTIFDVS